MTPSPSLRADTLRHIDELLARCPSLASLSAEIIRTVEAICACHRAGGKLLVCGNGGSAADSEHIVGELVKGFVLPRAVPAADADRLRAADDFGDHLAEKLQRGVAAISLTGHPSLATAIDNDTGRDLVFAQQVYVYGRPGDILVGLSTSGNSGNVLRALTVARAFGLLTVGFTGGGATAAWTPSATSASRSRRTKPTKSRNSTCPSTTRFA